MGKIYFQSINQVANLEELSIYYKKFDDILKERYKLGKFDYTIEPDYENLTVTIEFEFDDNTKGDPQLN